MLTVTLCKPNGLARTFTEVIKFCPPGFTASNRLDIEDIRRMNREYPLDTLIVNNTPYSERFVYAPAFPGDYRAGKNLRTNFIAFLDSTMHIHYITYLEVRDIIL